MLSSNTLVALLASLGLFVATGCAEGGFSGSSGKKKSAKTENAGDDDGDDTPGDDDGDDTPGNDDGDDVGDTDDGGDVDQGKVDEDDAGEDGKLYTDEEKAAIGPCSGKKKLADIKSKKQILFYRPADTHGGSSYIQGVKQILELAGYTVTMADTIKDAAGGDKVDECELFARYKQVWMWLACQDQGDSRSMDQDSADAMNLYYKGGGGLVVMTDYHYNNSGADHCSPTNWGQSKDIDHIRKMLKVEFNPVTLHSNSPQNDGGYGKTMTPQGSHPLADSMKDIGNIWGTQIRTVADKDPKWLDADKSTAIIDGKSKGHKTQALVMAANYGYEFSITGYVIKAQNANKSYECKTKPQPFIDIADYFEKRAATTADSDADEDVSLRLADDLVENFEPSLSERIEMMQSSNPLEVNKAIKMLARDHEVGYEELVGYFEHQNFPARIGAVSAIASLWNRTDTISRLMADFAKPDKSKRMTLGLVRTFGAIGATEALPALREQLPGQTIQEVIDEMTGTIKALEALQLQ